MEARAQPHSSEGRPAARGRGADPAGALRPSSSARPEATRTGAGDRVASGSAGNGTRRGRVASGSAGNGTRRGRVASGPSGEAARRGTGRGLPVLLGRRASSDEPVSLPLALSRHILVSGASGFGKSAMLKNMVVQLAVNFGPDLVRLVLIDLKRGVEFGRFGRLPQLLHEVVEDPDALRLALAALGDMMERRYRALRKAGCHDVEELDRPVPRTVVVLDELAEVFMSPECKEVRRALVRLLAQGRAAGIYFVLATQRPSRDVLPGLLLANLSTRISLRASSRVNSMLVLETTGAEKLKEPGEFLLSSPVHHEGIVHGVGLHQSASAIRRAVAVARRRYGDPAPERIALRRGEARVPPHGGCESVPRGARTAHPSPATRTPLPEPPLPARRGAPGRGRAARRTELRGSPDAPRRPRANSWLRRAAVAVLRAPWIVLRGLARLLWGLVTLRIYRDVVELLYESCRFVVRKMTSWLRRHMPRGPRKPGRRRRHAAR